MKSSGKGMKVESSKDFWDWAVGQYENEHLRASLLALQESQGLIILEAMYVAWLGRRGQQISVSEHQQLRAAITPWVNSIVLPLRRQRRLWSEDTAMMTNRSHLLGLELDAERVLAKILAAALPVDPLQPQGADCTHQNLAVIAELEDDRARASLIGLFGK